MTVPLLVPGRSGATAVKTAIEVGRNIVHMNKTLDVVKIVVATSGTYLHQMSHRSPAIYS